MLCALPGVRVSVEGVAVTPAGSPVRVTFTGELNAPTAFAVTLTCSAAPPMAKLIVAGLSDRLKPGATGWTVTCSWALWEMEPETPETVTVELPPGVVEAAFKEICCGVPGVSVSAAGIAATPFGSPLRVTAIVPVKPFSAVAETVNGCALPPAYRVSDAGVTERLKPAAGGAAPTASES